MNCIGGVMLCVLVSSVIDRGIEPVTMKLVFVSSLLSRLFDSESEYGV